MCITDKDYYVLNLDLSMALAGSILALPCMGLFGLLSIIWIAQSRKEFAGYP
jgi:hypothetical protein